MVVVLEACTWRTDAIRNGGKLHVCAPLLCIPRQAIHAAGNVLLNKAAAARGKGIMVDLLLISVTPRMWDAGSSACGRQGCAVLLTGSAVARKGEAMQCTIIVLAGLLDAGSSTCG